MQLCLELHSLLVSLVHYIAILLQFIDLHFILLQFLITLLFLLLDLILELIDDLVVVFLVSLLELCDLILQGNGALQLLIIFPLQLSLYLGPIHLSPIELLMQFTQ